MTITYFGQIVLRYIFSTGIHWTEELTRYTNIALVMVGAAVMSGSNSHINISILEDIVPKQTKRWIILIQQLLTVIFFGAAIFIGFNMMDLAGTQLSTNMRIPMKLVYGIFPVAYIILVFQTIVYILNDILGLGEREVV